MRIEHFGGDQNAVFIPALGLLLVAVVLIAAVVVLAPRLRRAPWGRAVAAVAGLAAAAALVGAAIEAGAGVRSIDDQRADVAAALQKQGYDVGTGEAAELIDGSAVIVSGSTTERLRLRPTRTGRYEVTRDAGTGSGADSGQE